MSLKIPPDYPHSVPEISLQSLKNVPKKVLEELETQCRDEAESAVGDQMIFMLSSIVKSWLEDNNVEVEVVVETKTAVAVVDDSEYKEGTPVTVETYQAWWAGFYQEIKTKKAASTGNVQLSGKQHFIGSTAIYVEEEEEDEEEMPEEEEIKSLGTSGGLSSEAAQDVNWKVFEQEAGVDLDDLEFSDDSA